MLDVMDYIYTVYEEKSFSKAAKKLYITQSALSHRIKKAEEEVGFLIFDRSTLPISTTKDGDYYIRSIEAIKQIKNNIRAYARDVNSLQSGSLSLGGSSYFCSFIFPDMIARYKERYPGIRIDLLEGNLSDLRSAILNDEVDLVLETAIQDRDGKIENFFFKTEKIILAVPVGFEVNKALRPYQLRRNDIIKGLFLKESVPAVPLYYFKDVPFIKMKPGNDMYSRSTHICRNAGFEMKAAILVDQVMTSLNIASAGTGALFIRSDIVKFLCGDDRIVFYKIDDPLSTRTISWSAKKGRYLSRSAREFMSIANGGECEEKV